MPTIFMTTDAVGGVWQYSVDVASGLKACGFDTILAVCGPSPSAAQSQKAAAVAVHLIDTGLPLDWTAEDRTKIIGAAEELAALAEFHKTDLIHLNSPALAACVAFHAPVVAVQHSCVATWWSAVRGGGLSPDLAWRAALVSRGLRAADAVISPTRSFAATTAQTHGLDRLPYVIANGRQRQTTSQANASVAENRGAAFAFTAGRLWDDGKNFATLDEAAERIDFPLLAAGPRKGPQGGEAHFRNLLCLGTIDEEPMADILARKPIYVSAALYEPFVLAVLEAAQAGCCLILSHIPTFHELWEDAAVFVPPRDSQGFAEALATLGMDWQRREILGQKAAARAARYSFEAMIDGLYAVYRTLLPSLNFEKQECLA